MIDVCGIARIRYNVTPFRTSVCSPRRLLLLLLLFFLLLGLATLPLLLLLELRNYKITEISFWHTRFGHERCSVAALVPTSSLCAQGARFRP